MKQLNKFVTRTEAFAVGQPQGAASWGQKCHRSPTRAGRSAQLWHLSTQSGWQLWGLEPESCKEISPKHSCPSMASPSSRRLVLKSPTWAPSVPSARQPQALAEPLGSTGCTRGHFAPWFSTLAAWMSSAQATERGWCLTCCKSTAGACY